MTRTGAKWIAMAIVLVLTSGAWAQRERERDRERPDRRPEARSMADRPRGSRERQEHDERNRDRERAEREEHNRERERAEHEERNRERERAEREQRDERRRDEPRRGKPDVRIFRFEHIPAESFLSVIEQLSRKGPLGEFLSQIPIALSEHSNALVIIGPPEVMELFEKLADGLDRPSAFHERMAHGKKPEGHKKPEAHKKPAPKKPTSPKRPTPGKGPGGINEPAIIKAMGDPIGPFFHKALSEPVARELRLEKRQREAIHKVAQVFGQKVGNIRQGVIQAIRKMPPDQRAAHARKIVSHGRIAMGQMAGEARKHVFGILKPEQRKVAAKILGAPGPTGAKGAKPSGGCGKCAKSKAGAKGGCGGCGSKGKPTPTAPPRGCGGCGSKSKPTPTAAPRGCGSSPKPTAVPAKPRPTAAPRGCGGCGSKSKPTPTAAPSGYGGCGSRSRKIVLADPGNCKTSDF